MNIDGAMNIDQARYVILQEYDKLIVLTGITMRAKAVQAIAQARHKKLFLKGILSGEIDGKNDTLREAQMLDKYPVLDKRIKQLNRFCDKLSAELEQQKLVIEGIRLDVRMFETQISGKELATNFMQDALNGLQSKKTGNKLQEQAVNVMQKWMKETYDTQ